MSEIKVNSIKGVAASVAALSINNTDGTCTANITNNLSNRNLVIHGAFQIAQRGTSSTGDAYQTVDRWRGDESGTDESVTKSQVDVASGTTPYTLGFRKAFRLTNGNQTSGAGTADHATMTHYFEAQNISNSGWNYISATSYITLSFWVKASVAQNYYGYVRTHAGSNYLYPFETGSLTADTWTKVTKTISGNSNLTINNDNGVGFSIFLSAYRGTDQTGSITLNQWGAYDGTVRAPDYATTWWTTNDATFEITGVQLEVGSVATDFEHRSFGQELALCQRYFCKSYNYSVTAGTATFEGAIHGRNYDSNARSAHPIFVYFVSRMRANPTMTFFAGDGQSNKFSTGSTVGGTDLTTESTFGTSFINSESGIFHCDLGASVPAANLFAFQYTASAEL